MTSWAGRADLRTLSFVALLRAIATAALSAVEADRKVRHRGAERHRIATSMRAAAISPSTPRQPRHPLGQRLDPQPTLNRPSGAGQGR